jgi:hypothetical protein
MKKILFLALGLLASFQTSPARAYVLEGPSWAVPSFTVYLNLTASQGNLGANLATFPLTDGSTSYNQVYANAETIWSSNLKSLKINTVIGSNAQGVTMSNGLNEVGFSSTILGYSLGQYTLGLTMYYYNPSSNPSRMTQTSTAINPGWQWNSYRGNLTYPVIDLQRVALHESGHMIGLGHPDQAGQVVNAIMNSSISNTDNLTTDDLSGGQDLYGTPQAGQTNVQGAASPTPTPTPTPVPTPTPTPVPTPTPTFPVTVTTAPTPTPTFPVTVTTAPTPTKSKQRGR